MSYDHADELNQPPEHRGTPGRVKPLVDPALYDREGLRAALAARDISTLYRTLTDTGISQHRIARATGQAQSDVSEIIAGRQVIAYDVLARIATGLTVPRHYMGLSYGDTYAEDITVAEPEGAADMLRRHVLAFGAIAAFGAPVEGLGALADVGTPAQAPLPSRLSAVHVTQVRNLTQGLVKSIHAHGSHPQVSSAAAEWATSLLTVPAPEGVHRALLAAVAELHLIAGWAGLDAVCYPRAMYHYNRGLELAGDARDPHLQVLALTYAGIATKEHGHPNDGLKMLQLSQVRAHAIPPDHERRQAAEADSLAEAALALADLGEPDAAEAELAKSRDLWKPPHTDTSGDPHSVAARLNIARGHWDTAEPLAVLSVRRWQVISPLACAQSTTLLATVHLRAGERSGYHLAYDAITKVGKLHSARVRQRLLPLTDALDTRPGSDARDLARMARQIATTRM